MGMGKISILAPIMYNHHIETCQWAFSGLFCTLGNINLAVDSLVCFPSSRKIRGKGICVERYVLARNLPSTGYGDLVIFLEKVGNW